MKKILLLIILISTSFLAFAQTPFVCDGSLYLSLGSGGTTTFYGVTIDNVTGAVQFNALNGSSGANVNGIGYRITDNFIYGVNASSRVLYRIDATGIATALTTLNLNTSLSYYAGDITPDGDTLMLLGAGSANILYKVDLASPTYAVTSVALTKQSNGAVVSFSCADIAIDPITGKIYGYNGSKLVTYDRNTGLVDDVTYPNSSTADILGALFFDAFGNLKGYGRPNGGNTQNTFFNINKNTGAITTVTTGPNAQGNDGCSCPYTIKIQKTVDKDTVQQCDKVIFKFEIANLSGTSRSGVDLQDIMPSGFTATQILQNPYGGTVTGIGTNSLNITDMLVPVGTDSILVEAKVSGTALGTYFNQAIIFDLPAALGGTAVSDYPATVQVDDPTPITVIPHSMTVTAWGDTSICVGASSALLNVTVNNSTNTPFTYDWSPATDLSHTNIRTPLATPTQTTTYSVTVTDTEGCSASDDVTVAIDTLDIFLGNDTTICILDSVLLDASYPSLDGLQWLWSDGSTDTTYLAPGTGVYWVRVIDACGNIDSDTITVTESFTNVLTTMNMTPVTCYDGNDGSAAVSVIQGTAPFTYQWNISSMTTDSITGIMSDIHKVTVTDDNQCKNINQIFVSQPSEIIPTATLIDSALCYADASGSAYISAIGGVGAYAYAWGTIPSQTTPIAINLIGPATYTVSVTDANQCVKIDTISIPAPLPITLFPSSDGTKCFQESDAEASVIANGGTPDYFYQWDGNAANQTTATASNLASGTYQMTVTDANGCLESTFVIVGEAAPLNVVFDIVEPNCFGETTGIIEASITNGVAPYSFVWEDGTIGNTLDNIGVGIYHVVVIDSNSCTLADSAFLTQPELLELTTNVTDLSCFESKDGKLYMIAQGGTSPYEYSKDGLNFSNANIIYGLEAGFYPVILRDTLGCETSDFITVFQPTELIVNAGEDRIIEQGDSVEMFVATSYPSEKLTFYWEEEFIRNSLSCDTCETPWAKPLSDLFYTITVVDSLGCTAEDGIWVFVDVEHEVYVPNAFTPNEDNVNDIFIVHGKEGIRISMFRVYSRWGELVFEASDFDVNDTNFGWDGLMNGQKAHQGVYGWVIEAEFVDGVKRVFKGNVTLME